MKKVSYFCNLCQGSIPAETDREGWSIEFRHVYVGNEKVSDFVLHKGLEKWPNHICNSCVASIKHHFNGA